MISSKIVKTIHTKMLKKEEVKHIAALARIGLREKDIDKYQKDISSILDYFKKMEELDTEGIEPIGHITGRSNVLREDRENDFGSIGKDAIAKNAPELKSGQFKVKSVL